MSLETPITSHVNFENVYEPAEDSFLLLDALESELQVIRERIRPVFCLEIGSGSGVISTALATALGSTAYFICCDINKDACSATRQTLARNSNGSAHFSADVINTNMTGGLAALHTKVDLLVCNPPYVATHEDEYTDSLESKNVQAAWAGGGGGRSMTDQLIRLLPSILSPNGVAYVVLEQCNNFAGVEEMAETSGLSCSTVIRRRAGRELLSVVKLSIRKVN